TTLATARGAPMVATKEPAIPAPAALADRTAVVLFVTDRIVVLPAMWLLPPDSTIGMPTSAEVKFAVAEVIVGELAVVTMSPTVRAPPIRTFVGEALEAAAFDMTTVVLFVIALMNVLAAMIVTPAGSTSGRPTSVAVKFAVADVNVLP